MIQSRRQLQRGIRELTRHNPEAAVKAFECALNSCSVEDHDDLSMIFYYLGVTLLRLGRPGGAIRSFRAGSRLRKRSCYSRKMLDRFGNEYGMVRQASAELDDWRAFYSVHLQRYLQSKRTQRIATEAEGDMIKDLILDHWKQLNGQGLLEGRSAQEKLSIFKAVRIVFPYYVSSELFDNKVVTVDFLHKTRLSGGDRCRCGSGMPFMMCCGRTESADELSPGAF